MLPKIELETAANNIEETNGRTEWSSFYDEGIAQMMADPDLTDAEKQELLRQLELPDEEWEPIQLPEGAEPMSVTIIKMRRGEYNDPADWSKENFMPSKTASNSTTKDNLSDLRSLYEESIVEMLAEPKLNDEEKRELLRQLTLPDNEWNPTILPEGAEPLSATLIRMRRGE